MVVQGATQLPLPVGERIEVRGFDRVDFSPTRYTLTLPSPSRERVK
jgi:hypothetical protein